MKNFLFLNNSIMPSEVVFVLIAFIVIAIIGFVFYSLRVDRPKSEKVSLSEDGKTVGKMSLRWLIMACAFVISMAILIGLESFVFEEPHKGVVTATFFVSFMIASFVGSQLKKWMKLK